MVKKMLFHVGLIALRVGRFKPHIFIEVGARNGLKDSFPDENDCLRIA